MIKINAIGDACPLPVIKTKKALETLTAGKLEILVDNTVAVENLKRFAGSAGCSFHMEEQDGHFKIEMIKGDATLQAETEAAETPIPAEGKTIVVLASETMGTGEDKLGKILMKGFVFALTQLDVLPDTILLYNSGAKLSAEGSETLADLTALEQAGVQILTCGTCLDFFGITGDLRVGSVTNMYDIVEKMQFAARILRP